MSGIMAAIFASTFLAFPATFSSFSIFEQSPWLTALYPGQWLYNVVFTVLAIGFSFLYTSIIFKPDDVAENLNKQNAFIPGIRPGQETSLAFKTVSARLTMLGAIYLNLIVVVPSFFGAEFSNQLLLSGTSLLISVGVGLEVIRQISMYLSTQQYENLIFDKSEK